MAFSCSSLFAITFCGNDPKSIGEIDFLRVDIDQV